MLQTFLLVAVPAFITLTAAFYVLHRISREEPQGYGHRRYNSRPGNWASARSSDGDTVANRRSTAKSHTGECVICYEESDIVELYPCRHKSLCVNCVIKIISKNTRACPLCRARIQGYSEVF